MWQLPKGHQQTYNATIAKTLGIFLWVEKMRSFCIIRSLESILWNHHKKQTQWTYWRFVSLARTDIFPLYLIANCCSIIRAAQRASKASTNDGCGRNFTDSVVSASVSCNLASITKVRRRPIGLLVGMLFVVLMQSLLYGVSHTHIHVRLKCIGAKLTELVEILLCHLNACTKSQRLS